MWMALQIKKWPHIFSTNGAIVPTRSLAFLGTGNILVDAQRVHNKECI